MNEPLVYKLDSVKLNFEDLENNLINSSNINLPIISLGFHDFIHRTKSSLTSITKKLDTENKFYNILIPFESIIPSYEDSINNLSVYYFTIESETLHIKLPVFYKIWEILFGFKIINNNSIITILSNNCNPIIQAILNFKEKDKISIKDDKIFCFNKDKITKNEVQTFYKKKVAHLSCETLDLLDYKINNKTFSDLIISDIELEWIDDKYQEQLYYEYFLKQIVIILKTQSKNGNLIFKFYETFTLVTIKLIYILTSLYEDNYIYKPFFSRTSESEKYLILKNFKYDQNNDKKLLNDKIKSLEKIIFSIEKKNFISDIYPKLNIPKDYINKFKFINKNFVNSQQIIINEMIKYIKENNYFGNKYHDYRDIQIEATKWWVTLFFAPYNLFQKK